MKKEKTIHLKRHKAITVIILILLVLGVGYFLTNLNPKKQPDSTASIFGLNRMLTSSEAESTSIKWSSYIDTRGPKNAYEQFKKDISKELFINQHILVHVFSNVLYKKAGIKGLTVCDDKFVGGCYHGFFAKAIGDGGINIVEALSAECAKKPQLNNHNCSHGIGHGLMYYFGQFRLIDALKYCQRSDWNMDLKGGCMSGVFMEYNLNNTDAPAAERAAARKFNARNPYSPCEKMPYEFTTPCYTELPRWWEVVLEDRDVYGRISTLCANINETILRYHCYVGTGTIAPTTADHDVKKTIALCRKMLTANEGIPICLQSASWRFEVVPEQKKNAYKLCEMLPVAYRKYCAQKGA